MLTKDIADKREPRTRDFRRSEYSGLSDSNTLQLVGCCGSGGGGDGACLQRYVLKRIDTGHN